VAVIDIAGVGGEIKHLEDKIKDLEINGKNWNIKDFYYSHQ